MTNTALYTKLSTLSPLIQKEVSDYIEFLIQKQQAPEKQRIHLPSARNAKTQTTEGFGFSLHSAAASR